MRSNIAATPVYLLGFAEALAAPEVCFSLRTAGARIVCFCRPAARRKFARLKFVEYCEVTAPESDFQRSTADIHSLIEIYQPEIAIPCDDAALLLLARLGNVFDKCLCPVGDACQFALDKWAQIETARDIGFAVPPTKLVGNEADVARFPYRPAMLKPRAALDISAGRIRKGRNFVISREQPSPEIRAALAREPYLIQEYKVGTGEGFFGIAQAGKVYAGFGHRRLRMMNPAGSGASACVSRQPEPGELEAAEALVKRIAWQGPFMIEMLRDAGDKPWFVEFNGRFWGSLALARRCGFDMPRLAVDFACGRDPEIPSLIEPGFARHLGRDFVHLLFVLRGPSGGMRAVNWPGRLSTLKAILRRHPLRSFYNYDLSQPFFFIKDAVVTVVNAVSGRAS